MHYFNQNKIYGCMLQKERTMLPFCKSKPDTVNIHFGLFFFRTKKRHKVNPCFSIKTMKIFVLLSFNRNIVKIVA